MPDFDKNWLWQQISKLCKISTNSAIKFLRVKVNIFWGNTYDFLSCFVCVIVNKIDDSNFLTLSHENIQRIILDKETSDKFIGAYDYYKSTFAHQLENSSLLFTIPSESGLSEQDQDSIVVGTNNEFADYNSALAGCILFVFSIVCTQKTIFLATMWRFRYIMHTFISALSK